MLIEPGELQNKLNQPGLRILDTRPAADYAKSHLPGAVRVDVKLWQELGKKEGGFHDAKTWGEKVGQLGISHNSQVVVYGSSLPDTARIWWTLKYLGLPNVTILDGGWELWVKEKRSTDASAVSIAAVRFEPKFQADRLEEIDSLKKSLQSGKVAVVDARSTDEFTGKEVRESGVDISLVRSIWNGKSCWLRTGGSSRRGSCGTCFASEGYNRTRLP